MITYGRPRLITEDDKYYRAYVESFKLQRKNQKAMRPPRQRDLFGAEAETALRAWLGERLELDQRRILAYEERRNRRGVIKYRELDALHLADRSAWVFEIKASRTASALRRAVGQLQETRAILKLLYPTVRVTILLVDTGIPASVEEVEALMASDRPPPRRPELLSEVTTAVPELRLIESLEVEPDAERIDVLRFGVEDISPSPGRKTCRSTGKPTTKSLRNRPGRSRPPRSTQPAPRMRRIRTTTTTRSPRRCERPGYAKP